MKVEIKPVGNRRELKQFVALPAKFHKNHLNWVPPIYIDDLEYFDPKSNSQFEGCDYVLVLAYVNGEVVGRCMGLIHHAYNQRHSELDARFCYIETANEPEVFEALITYISNWASQLGMKRLVGPLGFSDKDPQGFLIEGYDEPVAIATNCNHPYMNRLVENLNFEKLVDLVVYKIDIPPTLPEVYTKVNERFIRNNSDIRTLEFISRRKVRPYIRPVLSLINKTFTDIYGFTPFTPKEMDHFANRYLYLINPRFIKVAVDVSGQVIGTIIGMSDIGHGIQKARGRLFPFGWYHILTAGTRSKQLNLLLGAVDPKYQGRGLDVFMGIKMIESAKKCGKTIIDSHLELETNTKVRAEMERMGGIVYKRYRIYQKMIG